MPFLDDHVDLRHLDPEGTGLRRKVYFQILKEFSYQSRDGSVVPIPVHDVEAVPPTASATDLASVPSPLWGLIASYGRQSKPALLHDFLCEEARRSPKKRSAHLGLPGASSGKYRRKADWLFWQALRDQNVGPVERTLMWAAVRYQAMWEFHKGWLVWSLALTLASMLAVWTGLDVALRWLSAWEPLRSWFGEGWPTDLGLPVGWPPTMLMIGLAVGVAVPCLARRRDVALAALVAAPGLYVAVPVGLVNVTGLVLLWLASLVVYAPIVVLRWLLKQIDRLVSGSWAWLGRLLATLGRERRPEIGPTNSM